MLQRVLQFSGCVSWQSFKKKKKVPGENKNIISALKTCSWASHHRGDGRGQHSQSARDELLPGETTFPGERWPLHLQDSNSSPFERKLDGLWVLPRGGVFMLSQANTLSADVSLAELLVDLALGKNILSFNQSSWRMIQSSPLVH